MSPRSKITESKTLIVIVVAIILFVAGIITNYMDSARVRTGNEPKFCIKTVSYDGNKVTYWGLGYKVIRYVGVSPKEPYKKESYKVDVILECGYKKSKK